MIQNGSPLGLVQKGKNQTPKEKGKGSCVKRWEVKDLCSCLMCQSEEQITMKGKAISMKSTVTSLAFLNVSKSDFIFL